jgi:hypothetical protein
MIPVSNCNIVLPFDGRFAYTAIPACKKGPTKKSWNELENAIRSLADSWQLSGANVGLLHAYSFPNTCALDMDQFRASSYYLENVVGIDFQSLQIRSKLAIVESGRSDSLKILFTLPELHQGLPTKVVKDNYGKILFELRCADANGKSVCDVIPPSIHPIGTPYIWSSGLGLEDITTIPEALLSYWLQLIQKDAPTHFGSGQSPLLANSPLETPRKVALLCEMLRFISADCCRDEWKRIVFAILSSGYQRAPEIAYEWSITSDRYTEKDFQNLVRDYRNDKAGVKGVISLGTIYHHARKGGWHG